MYPFNLGIDPHLKHTYLVLMDDMNNWLNAVVSGVPKWLWHVAY
jgi:hypothetical protein